MPSLKHLSWCGFAIALSCSPLIEVAGAIPLESLKPRKNVDANLICAPPSFGLPGLQAWPANAPLPRSNYHNLHELCAMDQAHANVGCLCDPVWERVECRPDLGDPVLHERFMTLCLDNCLCQSIRATRALRMPPPQWPPPSKPFRGPKPPAGTITNSSPGQDLRPVGPPPQ